MILSFLQSRGCADYLLIVAFQSGDAPGLNFRVQGVCVQTTDDSQNVIGLSSWVVVRQ